MLSTKAQCHNIAVFATCSSGLLGPRLTAPFNVSSCPPIPRPITPLSADPRFEATAGEFKPDLYRHQYDFLSGMREKEIEALEAAKKVSKRPEEREELGGLLSKLKQHRGEDKHASEARKFELERKRAERKAVEGGKAPYFPKKREIKEWATRVKFSSLEATGAAAADKAILRRRKKVLSKERKSKAPPFRIREGGSHGQ
jgi:ribosomal RNA-processing protein 36